MAIRLTKVQHGAPNKASALYLERKRRRAEAAKRSQLQRRPSVEGLPVARIPGSKAGDYSEVVLLADVVFD